MRLLQGDFSAIASHFVEENAWRNLSGLFQLRYNKVMLDEHRHLPDANRLSVLVAAILLAFALAQVVETQRYSLSFNILGVGFSLPLNLTTAATLLAAGLTAAGMDWLLRSHPRF